MNSQTVTRLPGGGKVIDLNLEGATAERLREVSEGPLRDHVSQLVISLHRDAPAIVDRAVRRILAQVDGYERTGTVEQDDLWWSVYRNLEVVLLSIAEDRPLEDAELAVRRELGRRRAQQGMPVDDVMRAFRVGYAVLWESLSDIAHGEGKAYTQALLERAARVWMTFDQVTSAVADAHAEVVATQHVDRRRRALGLLSGLRHYPTGAEATEELARSLGLDPVGPFTIAVQSSGEAAAPSHADLVAVEQPDRVVVIAPWEGDATRTELNLAELLRREEGRHIGIGVGRRGLSGARQSLADAEWAHEAALTLDIPVVRFRDEWLTCLALHHHGQLGALVAPAMQALRRDHAMCQTLGAFLELDGNLTATGRHLDIHPNTVAYRLRQFARRTGIDPRTASGMALVQVALAYVLLDGEG